MNKSLYYIECKCIKNIVFPNVTIKEGEIPDEYLDEIIKKVKKK